MQCNAGLITHCARCVPLLPGPISHQPVSWLQAEFAKILKDYVGRESPLYHAERLSEHYRQCAATCALAFCCRCAPGTGSAEPRRVQA